MSLCVLLKARGRRPPGDLRPDLRILAAGPGTGRRETYYRHLPPRQWPEPEYPCCASLI